MLFLIHKQDERLAKTKTEKRKTMVTIEFKNFTDKQRDAITKLALKIGRDVCTRGELKAIRESFEGDEKRVSSPYYIAKNTECKVMAKDESGNEVPVRGLYRLPVIALGLIKDKEKRAKLIAARNEFLKGRAAAAKEKDAPAAAQPAEKKAVKGAKLDKTAKKSIHREIATKKARHAGAAAAEVAEPAEMVGTAE
jgi:hypothetical protein